MTETKTIATSALLLGLGLAFTLGAFATPQDAITLPKGTVLPGDGGLFMRPWVQLDNRERQLPIWYVTLGTPTVTGHDYTRIRAKDRLGALSAVTVWSEAEWANGGLAAEQHVEAEHHRLQLTRSPTGDDWDPFDRMTVTRGYGEPTTTLAEKVCIDGPTYTVPSGARCVPWADFLKWLDAAAK